MAASTLAPGVAIIPRTWLGGHRGQHWHMGSSLKDMGSTCQKNTFVNDLRPCPHGVSQF